MNIAEENKIKRISTNETHRVFEKIIGCKWSITIFSLIRNGINRPGKIEKSVDGLTTKVLNTCLKKSLEFKILEKTTFNELPPRVEYNFTPFGFKFIEILDQIDKLDHQNIE